MSGHRGYGADGTDSTWMPRGGGPMAADPMAADPMAADPMGARPGAGFEPTVASEPTAGFEGWNAREEPPGRGLGGPDDPWDLDDGDDDDEGDGRRRLLLTVGAAVLVALLGAGAVMFVTSGAGEGNQQAQAAAPAGDEPAADPEPTSSDDQKEKDKNQDQKNQQPRLGGVSLSQKCIDEYGMGAEPLVIAKFKGNGTVVYEWFQNGHGLEKEKIQVSGTTTVKQLMPGTYRAEIKVSSPRSVNKTLSVSAC